MSAMLPGPGRLRAFLTLPERAGLADRTFIALVVLLVAWQILIPPVVGVADNGDFEKVLGYVGLRHSATSVGDKYFRWVNRTFDFAPLGWYRSGYLSSEIPIAHAARVLSRWTSTNDLFDLRWIGFVHGVLFTLGLALIGRASRGLSVSARLVGLGIVCFAVTDAGYAANLNTFYSHAASMVFLLMVVGTAGVWLVNLAAPGVWPVLFLASAVGFVTSKPQEAPQSVLLATAFVLMSMRSARSRTWLAGSAALGLIGIGAAMFVAAPPAIRHVGPYHMVFAEILPNSPDPSADLRWFGLDRRFLAYTGTHAYLKRSPINEPWFVREFFGRVSSERIVLFYLAHPRRTIDLVARRSRQTGTLLPPGFGTFEKSAGRPPRAVTTRFTHWSSLKRHLAKAGPWMVTLLFPANIVLALTLGRQSRHPPVFECFAILNLMALGAFFICAFGDSLENERHLFTFNVLTDLVITGDLMWLASASERKVRSYQALSPVEGA